MSSQEDNINQYLKIRRQLRTRKLDPTACALIVVDMQEYQVSEDSSVVRLFEKTVPGLLQYFLGRVKELVIPNIIHLLEFFRAHDLPVYFTKFASMRPDRKDYAGNIRAVNKLAVNLIDEPIFPDKKDPSASIIPALTPQGNDVIILKTTSGTFSSTDLDHQLRNLGVSMIIVTGVVTNFCVENTARIAADLGYNVVLVDDACAAWTSSLHEATLCNIELMYGSVLTTREVLKKLKKNIQSAVI
jgi:nicotinamidase-related amidase